ncbi:Mur ligase [Ochromonadaceae sp. CCMP2298]|nr:Mur ligase [Ochromonadaceae sp. CCMP2298]
MSYSTMLTKLYRVNMFHPVKLGLDNMNALNALLKHPLKGIPVVHVAGTNGKGSVSLKIANSLISSGITTGLFASPHISSFRERVQVDSVSLSEEDVSGILPELFDLCETHRIPGTFFELTTALAFAKFQRAGCGAVVLEAGLGGRLDATNVVTPVLSIITSVQLDHMAILGDTVEKIAIEKAGIMKKGVAVLVGPGCPVELLKVRTLPLLLLLSAAAAGC